MRKQFSLFQSHLDLAHDYWSRIVAEGDTVIDATCGNGHDTVFLSKCCLGSNGGHLYSMDIQEDAILAAKELLGKEVSMELTERVIFINQCHSQFPSQVRSAKLIVYNLGYLPGGDKSITTSVNSTVKSLKAALELLEPGGAISITCYPGHEEGKREEEQLLEFVSRLDPKKWSSCHHRWLNRQRSPSLILLQKS